MPTIEHRGRRGEPFPVTFARAEDLELRWAIDLEHGPEAMTPLAAAVPHAGREGGERAWTESGVTMPSPLRLERPQAHGYTYTLDGALPPDEQERFSQQLEHLAAAHGGSAGVWANHSLPFIRASCGALAAATPMTSFRDLACAREHVWGHTAVAGAVSRLDEHAAAQALRAQFGARALDVAHELAQGSANDTLTADAALWQLATLPAGSSAAEAARRAFLDEHGSRAVGWSIDNPTLQERPDLLDVQLRVIRAGAVRDPALALAQAAQRRDALIADLGRASSGPADGVELARAVAGLAAFVPVREARARWQLRSSGLVRAAVLARGRVLTGRGVLERVEDVFFLQPGEYDQPDTVSRGDLAARRAEHDHWRSVAPPLSVGLVGGAAMPPAGAATEARVDADGRVHGVVGSPGVASGPARVILDLADAERLAPGDVLVTTMTSPPWTPLFGLVAAVVTDAGDAISHVAIAARDYGIPCVVGTGTATTRIRDGVPVTVDGDRGEVRLDERDPG